MPDEESKPVKSRNNVKMKFLHDGIHWKITINRATGLVSIKQTRKKRPTVYTASMGDIIDSAIGQMKLFELPPAEKHEDTGLIVPDAYYDGKQWKQPDKTEPPQPCQTDLPVFPT